MGVLHFLNVGQGDCSIIQHATGRVTVIDVCNARSSNPFAEALTSALTPRPSPTILGGAGLGFRSRSAPPPGFGFLSGGAGSRTTDPGLTALVQALCTPVAPAPENPIRYMRERGITDVFRFILTHPDMDHMDGISDLFAELSPVNFWDTANTRTVSFAARSPYREEDWRFYRTLRDGAPIDSPRRLTLHAGAQGPYYNQASEDDASQDGLYVLAPTSSLIAEANRTEDYNDASYVILYRSAAGRILFCGDAHDKTWEHLLANHLGDIRDVELMIAPHHGRDSGRDRAFLGVVRPKFTLFGTAPSEHLAYDAWRNRGLSYITSQQAGTVVVGTNGENMQVYVTRETFARGRNPNTTYSSDFQAWHLGYIA